MIEKIGYTCHIVPDLPFFGEKCKNSKKFLLLLLIFAGICIRIIE